MDKTTNRKQIAWLTAGLSAGLLFMGFLRWSSFNPNSFTALSGLATPGYILMTVLFTVVLVRRGLPLREIGFGFGIRPDLRQIILIIGAIAIIRILAVFLNPVIEELVGGGRNLERFNNVEGSYPALIKLLIMSWTLAAFGEEFVYRIVLMRSLAFIFGDSTRGDISAVVLQAFLFGLIHAYQGPAGIAGSAVSGLIFGAVTIAGRWSIWPAAITHGINNTIGIIKVFQGT